MADAALIGMARLVLLYVTLPAFLIILPFGARGLLWGIGASFVGGVAWLVWLFVLGGIKQPTGMEGIVLFILPLLWILGSLWGWVIYLLIALFGFLPHQRQGKQTDAK